MNNASASALVGYTYAPLLSLQAGDKVKPHAMPAFTIASIENDGKGTFRFTATKGKGYTLCLPYAEMAVNVQLLRKDK